MENNLQILESWYVIEVANIDNIIIWQEKNGRIYVSRGEKTEESFESLSEYILKIWDKKSRGDLSLYNIATKEFSLYTMRWIENEGKEKELGYESKENFAPGRGQRSDWCNRVL